MAVAIDTNVLLDLVIRDAPHHAESVRSVSEAAVEGPLIVSEFVYAELAAHYDKEEIATFLADTQVYLQRSSREALARAGEAWRHYLARRDRTAVSCPRCGSNSAITCRSCGNVYGVRQHAITDFLIGAHALVHAGRLLTRDRGYYATYFPDLVLV